MVARARTRIFAWTARFATCTWSSATWSFSACLIKFCTLLRVVLLSDTSSALVCSSSLLASQSSMDKFWYIFWASVMTSFSCTPCLRASLRAASSRPKSWTSIAPISSRRILLWSSIVRPVMVLLRFFFSSRAFFFASASLSTSNAWPRVAAFTSCVNLAWASSCCFFFSSSCFLCILSDSMLAYISVATFSPCNSLNQFSGCVCKFCFFTNSITSCISSMSAPSIALVMALTSGT
mmetsp:Transcript_37081/g.112069  ORF Transcript_37081/g.112069 Transcript_37081/m.112069 type:complete len:236 (-) Transcript_37081:2329-3036(-)